MKSTQGMRKACCNECKLCSIVRRTASVWVRGSRRARQAAQRACVAAPPPAAARRPPAPAPWQPAAAAAADAHRWGVGMEAGTPLDGWSCSQGWPSISAAVARRSGTYSSMGSRKSASACACLGRTATTHALQLGMPSPLASYHSIRTEGGWCTAQVFMDGSPRRASTPVDSTTCINL